MQLIESGNQVKTKLENLCKALQSERKLLKAELASQIDKEGSSEVVVENTVVLKAETIDEPLKVVE